MVTAVALGNVEHGGVNRVAEMTVEGIENTETLIAFRAYSSHDLMRMFSVGADA